MSDTPAEQDEAQEPAAPVDSWQGWNGWTAQQWPWSYGNYWYWSGQGRNWQSHAGDYAGWWQQNRPSGQDDGAHAAPGRSGESRRASGSTTAAMASEENVGDEHFAHHEDRAEDEEASSLIRSADGSKKPLTGKDVIPEYSGDYPMREYVRRVRLFEAGTAIDPSFRAQRLMQKLTGQAWEATETIEIASLQSPDGVQKPLDHLWGELEPLEFLRVFSTLQGFYKNFRRARGQEMTAFDTAFRS